MFKQSDRYCMNNELFLKRLSEVCEWQYPKIADVPAEPMLEQPSDLDCDGDEVKDSLIGQPIRTVNDTHSPQIVKLKYQNKNCEDCGKPCPKGRKVIIQHYTSHGGSWRESCKNCGLHRDPRTGEFTLPSSVAASVYQNLAKHTGKYSSKYVKPGMNYVTLEHGTFIVKKLQDILRRHK